MKPCDSIFILRHRDDVGVSRRREKKERLRRDDFPKPKTCQFKVAVPRAIPERQADWKSALRAFFSLFSVFSVPSVRTLFFKNMYKSVSQERKALNPAELKFGVPRRSQESFLCVLCALCANPGFSRQVQKRIAPSQEDGALTPR